MSVGIDPYLLKGLQIRHRCKEEEDREEREEAGLTPFGFFDGTDALCPVQSGTILTTEVYETSEGWVFQKYMSA